MNNSAASINHTASEHALQDSLAAFTEKNQARINAQKRYVVLDVSQDGDDPKLDIKIGKARREVKRSTQKVEEQQRLHCKLAQQELAARYILAEEQHTAARLGHEEYAAQKTTLTARLTVAEEHLKTVEARLTNEGAKGRRLIVGPLKTHIESKAQHALHVVSKAKKKVKELEAELAQVRTAHQESTARLAFASAQLEQLLKLGETHLRVLTLQNIQGQLADPHVTVDRLALEELLAKWQTGFTELIERPLEAPVKLTFVPKEANLYYWADTGEIAATAIFDCPSTVGSEQWPKRLDPVFFDDPRERLEARRLQA